MPDAIADLETRHCTIHKCCRVSTDVAKHQCCWTQSCLTAHVLHKWYLALKKDAVQLTIAE